MFVASETSAFSRHSTQYISLVTQIATYLRNTEIFLDFCFYCFFFKEDGEIAFVDQNNVSLSLSRVEHAVDEKIELHPDPYPHWTLKEIYDQPEAIARTLGFGGRFYDDHRVKLGNKGCVSLPFFCSST